MKVIIFPQENGGVSVVHPAPEYADQIEAVAQKDVPSWDVWVDTEVSEENPSGGYYTQEPRPWRIVSADELPPYDTRDRWRWTNDGPLDIAPEQPKPAPTSLSFAQLLIGLVSEQWITVEEGRAWRDRTGLPAQVQAVISLLPKEHQFAAETRALAPSEVLRSDPLVAAMGMAAGKTEEEIDDFFRKYAGV